MKWDEYFYYSEESKSKLKWKIDIPSGRYKAIFKAKIGKDAGSLNNGSNYYLVLLNRKSYKVHRIIWELLIGKIPENHYIDHVDGNRENNCITNLRIVDSGKNARNRKISSNNTSEVVGVMLRTKLVNGKEIKNWVAAWAPIDKKWQEKWFSVNKYGFEEAKQLAISYRNDRIAKLNALGAGYTDRHMKGKQ